MFTDVIIEQEWITAILESITAIQLQRLRQSREMSTAVTATNRNESAITAIKKGAITAIKLQQFRENYSKESNWKDSI